MQISEFTFLLMVCFFPGMICAVIVTSTLDKQDVSAFYFIIRSFIFGFIIYIVNSFLMFTLSVFTTQLNVQHTIFDTQYMLKKLCDIPTGYLELIEWMPIAVIFLTGLIIISVLVAFISVKVYKSKRIFEILRNHKINIKTSFTDIWEESFKRLGDEFDIWVTVRDHKLNLCYQGWVKGYSDNSTNAEILINDVIVYNNDTGEEKYKADSIYISRNASDMTIEFYKSKIEKMETDNDKSIK